MYRKHAKAHSGLSDLVYSFERYESQEKSLAEAEQVLHDETDEELLALAEEEREHLRESLKTLEQDLRLLLVPKDPNDDKDTIVEIRAGTGGRGSRSFRGGSFSHVQPFCGSEGLEGERDELECHRVGGASRKSRSRWRATRCTAN